MFTARCILIHVAVPNIESVGLTRVFFNSCRYTINQDYDEGCEFDSTKQSFRHLTVNFLNQCGSILSLSCLHVKADFQSVEFSERAEIHLFAREMSL